MLVYFRVGREVDVRARMALYSRCRFLESLSKGLDGAATTGGWLKKLCSENEEFFERMKEYVLSLSNSILKVSSGLPKQSMGLN